jgi:hypothetical protein
MEETYSRASKFVVTVQFNQADLLPSPFVQTQNRRTILYSQCKIRGNAVPDIRIRVERRGSTQACLHNIEPIISAAS